MPRLPIVSVALAATLLLASCTAAPNPDPADPLPQGSVPPDSSPTDEPDPVAESPFPPCSEADAAAFSALSSGEMLAAPTGDYYPDYLPLPSCVIEEPDFGDATAFFLPATQTDFDALETAIAADQGAGVPSDGQGMSTDGEEWDGQRVDGVFLVPPSFGVTVDFIFIGVAIP